MKDLGDVLRECVGVFERLGVPYAVMGGIAVRAYAIPRTTQDVDITITWSRDRLLELYRALDELGYTIPEPYWTGWVDQVAGMAVVKPKVYVGERMIDIDLFLVECAFLQSAMERRRKCTAEGMTLWLVSPEDLVLMKLVAQRPRDLIDVADLLFTQSQLDKSYLRQWAARLGVTKELERSLEEADRLEP